MRKDEQKQKLAGPWRSVHGAIWLIGLAILAWQDWWWPGILVLVAISVLFEAILKLIAPQAFEKIEQTPTASLDDKAAVQPSTPKPAPEHRFDLLPSVCPKCGGPIRGHEVKWTSLQSAECPYCGMKLPMEKGKP